MDISLSTPSSDALRGSKMFWDLYEASFPANEREPPEIFLRGVESGKAKVVVAGDISNPIGFANVYLLRNPDSYFLAYICVEISRRGQGLGTKLLTGAFEACEKSFGIRGLAHWAETDDPAGVRLSKSEFRLRQQRIRFFKRLGFRVALSTYVQPPVDGVNQVPMLLISDRPLEPIERYVRSLYKQKHFELNGIPHDLLQKSWRLCGFSGRV